MKSSLNLRVRTRLLTVMVNCTSFYLYLSLRLHFSLTHSLSPAYTLWCVSAELMNLTQVYHTIVLLCSLTI